MREQQRSKTFRNGEPTSHVHACNNVELYASTKGYFAARNYAPYDLDYYHEYDVVICEDILDVINTAKVVVEVGYKGADDDSKHDGRRGNTRVNDSIAEGFAKRIFKGAKFVRISKPDTQYNDYMEKLFGL